MEEQSAVSQHDNEMEELKRRQLTRSLIYNAIDKRLKSIAFKPLQETHLESRKNINNIFSMCKLKTMVLRTF